jgi:hypothetical protein
MPWFLIVVLTISNILRLVGTFNSLAQADLYHIVIL